MADPQEVADPALIPMLNDDENNPLFPRVPKYFWQQYLDPKKNANSHDKLIEWIKRKLAQQAAAEKNGNPQEVTEVVDGKSYTFGLTAESGFFEVVVIPAAELTDEQRPVTLVFSFQDLYLLGFIHDNIWYMFHDARLDGSGHHQHPEAYRRLDFRGSYDNSHFAKVKLSNYDIHQSYESLLHYPERSRNEIRVAVFRYIVVISEACRFPKWHNYVQLVLGNMLTVTTNRTKFSIWFQDWSTISKKARRGAARFVVMPGDRFTTFESLVQTIDGGVALGRPPADQL